MFYVRAAWRTALASASLLLFLPLYAAEPLTLSDALRRAAVSHPDLQGFNAEHEAVKVHRSLATRSPNPEVGLLLEDAFGSGQRSGVKSAQWTLSFTQALELDGQRSGRLDVVDAQGAALILKQEQRRRDSLAEVTQRFIEAAVDRQRVVLAEKSFELAGRALESARSRVEAARAPIAERARARAALAQAVLEREHAEHEELSARVTLAVALGLREPDFGELQASFYDLPAIKPLEELRERLHNSPAAQARMAEAKVHEAEQRAALASAGLKPALTGGVRRYGSGDSNSGVGFVVGVSLPLFAGRAAGDQADAAAARYQQSEAENRGALLRADELLFEKYQELNHAREALRLLETEVLPAREEALQQTQYAYERGRYGYLELSQVLQERAAALRERADTAARFHSLLAELERITGETLVVVGSKS